MKANNDKIILKEDEGISTPKPFNRYDESDIEKTIKKIIEKEFKDFILLKYQHQGETQYINLNLSTELDEKISKDLELNRYMIGKIMAEFRQSFYTELSKFLNVVNIKVGPYDFSKNSNNLIFNTTILMSDNNISDWVSGNRKKTESNKSLIEESKNNSIKENQVKKILLNLYNKTLKESNKEEIIKRILIKLNESKTIENLDSKNINKIKIILEKLHKSIFQEALPKKSTGVQKPKKKVETKPEPQIINKSVDKKLQKTILEYYALSQEIEEIEEQQRKELEKRNLKQTKLYETIYSTMKSVNQELYVVDGIVAKLSAEYVKSNPKYAKVFDELLEKVNDDTKRLINRIKKKHTTKSTVYSNLSVEPVTYPKGRGRKTEAVIKEGIGSWFKSIFISLKEYLGNITSTRKKMQKLATQLNII